jgi:hypothetical protein
MRAAMGIVCFLFVGIAGSFSHADEAAAVLPTAGAPTSFAPAADLLDQVDFYIARGEESTSAPQAFDMAKQARLLKDAHTLAALGLALSMHDEDFPAKPAMPGLIRAAQRLAVAETDYDKARAALAEVKAARAGKAEPSTEAKWEKVASLPALMKQVPLVHTQLTRGTRGDRLARSAKQSAGQAATLAAIAQASILDTEYAQTPEAMQKWRQYCEQMRDAAGEVNSAIHAAQSERVTAAMKRLLVSCESCHAAFRHP